MMAKDGQELQIGSKIANLQMRGSTAFHAAVLKTAQRLEEHCELHDDHRRTCDSVLGYWVKPCGGRVGIREGENAPYAYPRS